MLCAESHAAAIFERPAGMRVVLHDFRHPISIFSTPATPVVAAAVVAWKRWLALSAGVVYGSLLVDVAIPPIFRRNNSLLVWLAIGALCV